MFIDFKNIRFKNFLSYGNSWQEFNFNKGVSLIIGSNGVGKSALLTTLFYVLYGKAYKKQKIGSLVNYFNDSEMLVEVNFEINNDKYFVQRGEKPKIFKIYKNDELINERNSILDYQKFLEQDILRISENGFKQIVIFGASASGGTKNFLDLTKSEREDIFNLISDTKIFQELKEIIKKISKPSLGYLQKGRDRQLANIQKLIRQIGPFQCSYKRNCRIICPN